MSESETYGRGEHPNSAAHRWRKGESGNPAGRPSFGASWREWIDVLAAEDEAGEPRYSLSEIKAVAEADADDQTVSHAKRIAAQMLVDLAESGCRVRREGLGTILDRTIGPPSMSLRLDNALVLKRSITLSADVGTAIPFAPRMGAIAAGAATMIEAEDEAENEADEEPEV